MRFVMRAGWPPTRRAGAWLGGKWWWQQRFGRWWVWIGPYVVGDLRRF